MKSFFLFIVILMALPVFANSSMTLSRNPVNVNETFTLEIRSDDTDASPPKLSLPDGIEKLQRNNILSRSTVQGQVSAEQRWVYKLVARRAGDFHFESVNVGKDRTNALTLTVNQKTDKDNGGRAAKLMLRADLDQSEVFLQQQVVLSVKLFRAVPVRFAQITEPQPPNVLIQQMGDDIEYETEENGQPYFVLERRYALYPQKPGRIEIAPIQFNGDITINTSNSLFGSIADTEPVSLQTAPSHLVVKEALTPDHWLPAKQVEMKAQLLPANKKVQAGEPLTINLSTLVAGQIAANVPPITFSDQDGWHYYPDQVKDAVNFSASGINLERTQKIAVVPTHAGSLQLPPLELPWYNTTTGTPEIARVTFEPITVVAAETKNNEAIVIAPTPSTSTTEAANTTPVVSDAHNYWMWLSALMTFLWLMTLLLWWRTSRRRHSSTAAETSKVVFDPEAGKEVLLMACDDNDAHAAQAFLLQWAREVLQQPDLSWAQLLQRSAPAHAVLHALDAALYSSSPAPWHGQPLADALTSLEQHWRQPPTVAHTSVLNP